jgi:hypothetical protein
MGMLVDKSDLNFGRRAWRYSPAKVAVLRQGKLLLDGAGVTYAQVPLPHRICAQAASQARSGRP